MVDSNGLLVDFMVVAFLRLGSELGQAAAVGGQAVCLLGIRRGGL